MRRSADQYAAMAADAADRIVDLYHRHARAWAQDRGTALIEGAWLDRFGGLVAPGGAILDIGCGAGEPLARYLVERGHPVTGLDSSSEMIALCRARFPDQDWCVGDMRALALGRTFDGLLAWDSFFHLRHEDQRRMFPLFRTHATPGAALMFTSGPAHGVSVGDYRGEPLYHASLDAAEYRALLDGNGFEVVAHAVADPDCGGHTVWLARSR